MDICAQYLPLISSRIDGELSVQEEQQLQAHLEQCPACRALLADLTAIHLETSQPEAPAPAGFAARVMERVAQEARQEARRRARLRHCRRAAGLAAALALVVWAAGPLSSLLPAKDASWESAAFSLRDAAPALPADGAPEAAEDNGALAFGSSAEAETSAAQPRACFDGQENEPALQAPVPVGDALTLTGEVPPALSAYPAYTWEDGSMAFLLPAEDFAALAEQLYALGMTGAQDTAGQDSVWIYVRPAAQ